MEIYDVPHCTLHRTYVAIATLKPVVCMTLSQLYQCSLDRYSQLTSQLQLHKTHNGNTPQIYTYKNIPLQLSIAMQLNIHTNKMNNQQVNNQTMNKVNCSTKFQSLIRKICPKVSKNVTKMWRPSSSIKIRLKR